MTDAIAEPITELGAPGAPTDLYERRAQTFPRVADQQIERITA